jgi:hypothetical protein
VPGAQAPLLLQLLEQLEWQPLLKQLVLKQPRLKPLNRRQPPLSQPLLQDEPQLVLQEGAQLGLQAGAQLVLHEEAQPVLQPLKQDRLVQQELAPQPVLHDEVPHEFPQPRSRLQRLRKQSRSR